jgi:hypothetical protein
MRTQNGAVGSLARCAAFFDSLGKSAPSLMDGLGKSFEQGKPLAQNPL